METFCVYVNRPTRAPMPVSRARAPAIRNQGHCEIPAPLCDRMPQYALTILSRQYTVTTSPLTCPIKSLISATCPRDWPDHLVLYQHRPLSDLYFYQHGVSGASPIRSHDTNIEIQILTLFLTLLRYSIALCCLQPQCYGMHKIEPF